MWDRLNHDTNDDRYRGQFDQISPIIDQITGEMKQNTFAITVSPAGGDATDDTADTLSGLIRNIENISNAKSLYGQVSTSLVTAGLDGFEIVQEFLDANTFDQDLIFKGVSDWYKSVWFDLNAIKQDKSDSQWAIKLRELPKAQYKKQFPKGKGQSIGDNTVLNEDHSFRKFDSVTVGKLYYKKPINIEVIKMNNGAIYEDNEDFQKIKDELAQAGIVEEDRRTRKSWRVWTRLMYPLYRL